MAERNRLNREESRAQTRALLMKSAASAFARNGFEGASVDQISEGAGFSRGAFYSNFSDKEAIFLELLRRHLDRDLAAFEKTIAKSDTLDDLARNVGARYRDLGDNPDWCLLSSEFQLFISRGGRQDGAFFRAYAEYRADLTRLIEQAFERFGFHGELSATELASALIGLSHGLALERAATGSALPMETTGRALRALLFGAAAGPGERT
ncbi:MAG: TetR/AcrR family transcriptional regulator [Phenylobacterium sp.]